MEPVDEQIKQDVQCKDCGQDFKISVIRRCNYDNCSNGKKNKKYVHSTCNSYDSCHNFENNFIIV
jgi:hypothetical protein